jgi:hypothetical protein
MKENIWLPWAVVKAHLNNNNNKNNNNIEG